jgi:hypothetical protein
MRDVILVARAGQWIRQALLVGLGLLALALITGSLGNLSRTLNGVLAVSALLGLVLLWPRRTERTPPVRLALAAAIAAGSLFFIARGEPLGLLGAVLFFFALTLLPLRDKASATVLLLTSLFFALFRLLTAYVPVLWHLEQKLAITSSWFVGNGLMLGPTALGVPLFFLFLCYALSRFLATVFPWPTARGDVTPAPPERRWPRAVLVLSIWLLGLVLAVAAYVWLQPTLALLFLAHWPAPPTPSLTPPLPPTLTYLESQLLLFLLLWLVSAFAGPALHPRPLPLVPPRQARGWAMMGLGLLALATLVLTLEPPLQPQRGTILFYDTGHLDWKLPTFGQYGPHSGGDFGLWPGYLAAYGYEARAGQLTDENLRGARAVVIINPPDLLPGDQRERLLSFVDHGGGLIIVGEHTGVGRIREPINDLLAQLFGVPISLEFDSAVPTRLGWTEGLTFPPHPVTASAPDPMDLVIAVGASLQIDPPVRPLVVGRFGHSDIGDVTNRAMNYVGDMRYNPGERLGDVVLMAEAQYGQGRIVVLGDTTPLGSVNLMTSMPFHARLLDWVVSPQPAGRHALLRNGWLAVLLLLVAGVCLALGRSRVTVAGAALAMGLTLLLTTRLNTARITPLIPSGPIAYIDVSHQERLDRMLWQETSVGGLNYNLVRNGALPLLLREIDAEALAGADLLVVIAPGGRFSAKEIDTVTHWVEAGGRLLVATGWEESEASQALLAPFGLEVDHIPLGPVEVARGTGLVRFHEAWPVSSRSAEAETLLEAYGYPLIVYQPWGEVDPQRGQQGGVILIGDSRFLLGGTLEGEDTYSEGNILLLRDIMQDYLGFADQSGEAP